MIRKLCFLLLWCCACALANAQPSDMQQYRGVTKGGYNFWVYAPHEYYAETEPTPLIIFLHGASLRGTDLQRLRRYGTLDAIDKGREMPALVVAPQNPSGHWIPEKVHEVKEWMCQNYEVDTRRIYVLGMSLGGYGTMDYVATYPDEVAAAMALCGGCTKRDVSALGEVPLWIIHGTADRAVSVNESKKVMEALKRDGLTDRLLYDWWAGVSHGALARLFYLNKTYEWLLAHSLDDPDRAVCRDVDINKDDLKEAYGGLPSRRQ